MSEAPKELEQVHIVRQHQRERHFRDTIGEEQLIAGDEFRPPFKHGYSKEFTDLAAARKLYEELRTVVRVRFVQMYRQDNRHEIPFIVRWGVDLPDIPLDWRPPPDNTKRADVRFGICTVCNKPWKSRVEHAHCLIEVARNKGRLTHIRTWGDAWGFEKGTLADPLAFSTFKRAHEYIEKNWTSFGWMRLQRFSEDDTAYYIVERRIVGRRKPQPRQPRTEERCKVCNLTLWECPGMKRHEAT